MLYLKCKMRNVISHFAFQILPFGFVAMAYGIPNLVLAGDIVMDALINTLTIKTGITMTSLLSVRIYVRK